MCMQNKTKESSLSGLRTQTAERSTREFETNILKGLSDLGINPDEPPVRQSERSELYQNAVQQIIESGKAYYCNCSKERLDEMRSKQQSKGLKPQYDGKCRNLNLKLMLQRS